MREAAKRAIKKAKQAGITGIALAAFAATTITAAAAPHLVCSVNGEDYRFALFSNLKNSNNNPRDTTLAELSHFDEQATAFGQYSIAAHTLLALSSWCIAYDLTSRSQAEKAPLWYRTLIGTLTAATLILAGLFIDIAENHSTTGVTIDNQHKYRVTARRGTGGYALQFIPLTLCFLLWVKDLY